MASIDVGIHPDPARIGAEHFHNGDPFSVLRIRADGGRADIFVHSRAVLGALYDALDEIRTDMDKAAQTASDQVPTEMADWPAGDELEFQHAYGYL